MLKILQARFQQYMNQNFQMFKLGLEKAEEPEIKLPTSPGSWKKKNSRKTFTSYLLTVCITSNCGKLFKRWEYQTILLISWEIWLQIKKQQLEPYVEKKTGSKLESSTTRQNIVTLFV